jgi:hypothetical protein
MEDGRITSSSAAAETAASALADLTVVGPQ